MIASARTKAAINGWRLTAFVTVSIAAHCLLLAAWTWDDNVLPPASRLTVSVIASDRTSQSPTKHTNSIATIRHKDAPVERVARAEKMVSATTPAKAIINHSPVISRTATQSQRQHKDGIWQAVETLHNSTDSANTVNDAKADIPAFSLGQLKERADEQLHNNFARHFRYPYLAQRRNWQGEVRLGLRIEASGRLSHIHVIRSSGYAILDQAALDSLRKVAAIPDADHWLHGNTFDTVLPVEYRLIDS